MLILIHLVVSLGMLVIVPLGLSLVNVPGGTTVRRWWLVAAVPGVISLWLGRGALSITLASIYLTGTLALALLAANDLISRKRLRAGEIALYTALVTPAIAALALVAERSSYELFGFSLTVLSLTVAHFHFAGFAAALVACLVVESTTAKTATAAAISVPLGDRHRAADPVGCDDAAGAQLGVGACGGDAVPATALDGCYTWLGERARLRLVRTAGLAPAEGVG